MIKNSLGIYVYTCIHTCLHTGTCAPENLTMQRAIENTAYSHICLYLRVYTHIYMCVYVYIHAHILHTCIDILFIHRLIRI